MADLDIAVQEYVAHRKALALLQEDEVLQNCTSAIQAVMTLCLVAADGLLDAINPGGWEVR
jgi:hypothetical protein